MKREPRCNVKEAWLACLTLQALTKAIRLSAGELQDVGLVGEAVEQCGGQALIAEDLGAGRVAEKLCTAHGQRARYIHPAALEARPVTDELRARQARSPAHIQSAARATAPGAGVVLEESVAYVDHIAGRRSAATRV